MNEEKTLNLKLSLNEVNAILLAVGERPYTQVFGLVAKIQQQASEQLGQQLNVEQKNAKEKEKVAENGEKQ